MGAVACWKISEAAAAGGIVATQATQDARRRTEVDSWKWGLTWLSNVDLMCSKYFISTYFY